MGTQKEESASTIVVAARLHVLWSVLQFNMPVLQVASPFLLHDHTVSFKLVMSMLVALAAQSLHVRSGTVLCRSLEQMVFPLLHVAPFKEYMTRALCLQLQDC
ncbi:hypothetical protein TRVL_03291 [Trypanosoma vivax]|nr:hypothetical protein TRVL_03291 [Trypanosoma vivax]